MTDDLHDARSKFKVTLQSADGTTVGGTVTFPGPLNGFKWDPQRDPFGNEHSVGLLISFSGYLGGSLTSGKGFVTQPPVVASAFEGQSFGIWPDLVQTQVGDEHRYSLQWLDSFPSIFIQNSSDAGVRLKDTAAAFSAVDRLRSYGDTLCRSESGMLPSQHLLQAISLDEKKLHKEELQSFQQRFVDAMSTAAREMGIGAGVTLMSADETIKILESRQGRGKVNLGSIRSSDGTGSVLFPPTYDLSTRSGRYVILERDVKLNASSEAGDVCQVLRKFRNIETFKAYASSLFDNDDWFAITPLLKMHGTGGQALDRGIADFQGSFIQATSSAAESMGINTAVRLMTADELRRLEKRKDERLFVGKSSLHPSSAGPPSRRPVTPADLVAHQRFMIMVRD